MPLYDCLMLMKPNVRKEMVMDLVARVGKRVYQRKGVITDLKSFGTIQLAYGIKKLDGKHFQGQLMQMTMMVPPSFNKELQYLNKEDRLLRWLVKHRANATYWLEFVNEEEGSDDFRMFRATTARPKVRMTTMKITVMMMGMILNGPKRIYLTLGVELSLFAFEVLTDQNM